MLNSSLTPDEIAAVRAPIERASTLPPRCYYDPGFNDLENQRIFRRHWLPVGRVDQAAQPGRFSHLEATIWQFQNWLLDQLDGVA